MKIPARIRVGIIRSTAKAHLINDESGRQGWIQKRWLAPDGTVAAHTFEKAVASFERAAAVRAITAGWQDAYHRVRFDTETERAVGTVITVWSADREKSRQFTLWFGKAILRDNKVPGWAILSNLDKILNQHQVKAVGGVLDQDDETRLLGQPVDPPAPVG